MTAGFTVGHCSRYNRRARDSLIEDTLQKTITTAKIVIKNRESALSLINYNGNDRELSIIPFFEFQFRFEHRQFRHLIPCLFGLLYRTCIKVIDLHRAMEVIIKFHTR